MSKKEELLDQFSKLPTTDNTDCVDCPGCFSCVLCEKCIGCIKCLGCVGCIDCTNCILCKSLHSKTEGFWLLNQQVSKKEFLQALEDLKS